MLPLAYDDQEDSIIVVVETKIFTQMNNFRNYVLQMTMMMIAMIMAPSIEAPGILVTWLSIPPHPIANGSDVSLPLDTITTNHSQTNAQLTNIIQAPSLTNKGLFFLFSFLCFLLLLRVVSFNDFHPILRIFPMYY